MALWYMFWPFWGFIVDYKAVAMVPFLPLG